MSTSPNTRPGKLVLENGFVLQGELFGAKPESQGGEVVFNTAMSGYQEIITDPSYAGQVVAMTYPLIGNYGINREDDERERVHMRGLIVRELSMLTSGTRNKGGLDAMLEECKVPGIAGVDTRALTRVLREQGAMKGIIVDASVSDEDAIARAKVSEGPSDRDFTRDVTLSESADWSEAYASEFAESSYLKADASIKRLRCAAIDYGAKRNILRCLAQAGFDVRVFPATASAEEILATNPDGIFLSNGPGDPALLTDAIGEVKKLLASKTPLFGICLGHQLMTWALGGRTFKLKFGHHGANHPVRDEDTGRVEITSQNHGFATDPEHLPSDVVITHYNLNDQTISGMKSTALPAFSVQFHPEASPGPHDSLHLFQRFYELASGAKV